MRGFMERGIPQYSARIKSGPLLNMALALNPKWAKKAENPSVQLNMYKGRAKTFKKHADNKNRTISRELFWGKYTGGTLFIEQGKRRKPFQGEQFGEADVQRLDEAGPGTREARCLGDPGAKHGGGP